MVELPIPIFVLNQLLQDWVMLVAWSVLFLVSLYCARKLGIKRNYLISLGCVPMMIYFLWAFSGWWSTHFVALAFNRASQLVTITIWLMFTVDHRKDLDGDDDNGTI